jgi:hypothetical protein
MMQIAYLFTSPRATLRWSGAGANYRRTRRASVWKALRRLLHRTCRARHHRLLLLVYYTRVAPPGTDGCSASR